MEHQGTEAQPNIDHLATVGQEGHLLGREGWAWPMVVGVESQKQEASDCQHCLLTLLSVGSISLWSL